MPERRRKSLRLQARAAASSPAGPSTAAVKNEIDDDDVKPCTPNVLPRHSAVKVETGDDGEVKPKIRAGHKMVHTQDRQLRRHHWGEYGRDSRYAYIMSIAQRIKSSPTDGVPGVGEWLFHNAFKCLIDAIVVSQTEGSEDRTIDVGIDFDAFDSLVPLAGREYYLQKILMLLLCMARMRVYDPPSDNEVIYYREIKKHIRCMIAYQKSKGNATDVQFAESKDPASYHNMSCSQAISAVEELIELTGTLAEINPHIWDLNHKNGSAPNVAIHVRSNFNSLPEPNWSTEKVNAFYYSKLILVLHDLKCSGLAGVSPDSSEKKTLDTLLDYVTSSSTMQVKEVFKMAVSDTCKPISITPRKRERETYEVMLSAEGGGVYETNGRFDGRLFEYVVELRRSCLSFIIKLMEKLEVVVYPQSFHSRFYNAAPDIINQWLEKAKINQWIEKPKVRTEKPPDYIEGVDQCIVLAHYASALIKGISSSVEDAFANLTDMLRRRQHWFEFGPEAVRVLSLLECGAFRKAGDKMEIPLHEVSSYDHATKTKDHGPISLKSNADNLKVLASILQVLKDIGPLDSFVSPSPAEMVLLEQILEHVSYCIDGFLSAKAYHIERELNTTKRTGTNRSAVRKMNRINAKGMFRGFPIVYIVEGGEFLVESLFKDFQRAQEDIDLMIPSLQKLKGSG